MASKQRGLMTSGVIWKELLLFSIPLLLGNLFQLLYNTVDSIVVGNFVGHQALAAVGASTPLINMLIGFFMGVAAGAGVLVSRFFGARKLEELHIAVHTFVAFTFLFGVLMMVAGITLTPLFLQWMGTPADIMDMAVLYLRIYFLGIIPTMLYNSGAGILQAVGDSRRPLCFLTIASVLNIILDLVFVIQLNMGVAGVAWATLIAQTVSCILVAVTLLRSKESYQIIPKKIRIDKPMLMQIVRLGIPSGLQQMIVSFSNVLVMSYVNRFGSAAIAGFSSANKFDNFLGLPVNSFMLAITTFVGQNMGAKQIERVKKGINTCMFMGIGIVIAIGIPAYLFSDLFAGSGRYLLWIVDDAHAGSFLFHSEYCAGADRRGARDGEYNSADADQCFLLLHHPAGIPGGGDDVRQFDRRRVLELSADLDVVGRHIVYLL